MRFQRDLGRNWGIHATDHLKRAFIAAAIVMCGGTIGFVLVERLSVLDALMITISLMSTEGQTERPITPAGKALTILVVVAGIAALFYLLGAVAEYVLGGHFGRDVGRHRMEKQIERLHEHAIICGFGRVGQRIAREFAQERHPFVVVDVQESRAAELAALGYLYVIGNATQDDVLARAGVIHATTLLAAANDDTENIAIVLSARALAPQLWIVARPNQHESEAKLRRAGADRVLSPYALGGHRMASLARHPHLADFVERAVREADFDFRIEELTVSERSPLAGMALPVTPSDLPVALRDCSVVAICPAGGSAWLPARRREGAHIHVGDQVIIVGPADQCQQLGHTRKGPPVRSAPALHA